MYDRLFADEKAAIAEWLAKNAVKRAPWHKTIAPQRDTNAPVVISRVAAKPVTMKLTQGFNFKSLSDSVTRR